MIGKEVRRRDGDQCRFCNAPVDFAGPLGMRGAYVHFEATQPPSAETVVIGCHQCARSEGKVLLPAPTQPIYAHTTARWLSDDGERKGVVNQHAQHRTVSQGNGHEGSVNNGFASVVREHRVGSRHFNRHLGRIVTTTSRKPRGRQILKVTIDPGAFDEAVHHKPLLDVVLNVVPITKLGINLELVPLVQDGNAHESFPRSCLGNLMVPPKPSAHRSGPVSSDQELHWTAP